MEKNKFGQYFTPQIMASFMVELSSKETDAVVLEPSCGQGVFIDELKKHGYSDIEAFEIDNSLCKGYPEVRCESFVSAEITKKYDLIIGNPPYIRWKNLEAELKEELQDNFLWNTYCNSLCDYLCIFLLKSVELLADDGELIFICPEYWMTTTHSEKLRQYLIENGYFESIYHFNEAPIFDNATVSLIVFKYIKSADKKPYISLTKCNPRMKITNSFLRSIANKDEVSGASYENISQFGSGKRWVLASDSIIQRIESFISKCVEKEEDGCLFPRERNTTVGDVCDIGNGMVSGLDKAFQIPFAAYEALNDLERKSTIEVYKAKDLNKYFPGLSTKYIFVDESVTSEKDFKDRYPTFYELLQPYKDKLLKRYQYGREIKYWHWVFKRNEKLFRRNKKRIYIPCKERISNKDYVRFAIAEAGFFPTQDVTGIFLKTEARESPEYLLAYLNQEIVFEWLKYYGIVKGNIVEFSEKPIASIPFRKINWDDKTEVEIHDRITKLIISMSESSTRDAQNLNEIIRLMEELWQH